MSISYISDDPITNGEDDSLNIKPHAIGIADAIRRTTPPFTYGILADWGRGKTSLLHLIQERLEKPDQENQKNRFIPIWFNAWQYENEQNIIYPLLYAIKRQYEKEFPESDRSKDFKDAIVQTTLISTLALTDVVLRALTKKLIDEPITLEEIGEYVKDIQAKAEGIENVLSGWADQVEKIHIFYAKLLDSYAQDVGSKYSLSPEQVRFVILIDDLDRCLPQTTIAILESIKNFLYSKKCIYVLALNPKTIYKGIQIKYQGADVDGREYLEKIINFSFKLDEVEVVTDNFVKKGFAKLVSSDHPKSDRYEECFDQFTKTIQSIKFTNPRKIKRIMNHFLAFVDSYGIKGIESKARQISQATGSEISYQVLIADVLKIVIIAEYFPQIFNFILKDPTLNLNKVYGFIDHKRIDGKDVNIKEFENITGIKIESDYLDMVKMKELFNQSTDFSIKNFLQDIKMDLFKPLNPPDSHLKGDCQVHSRTHPIRLTPANRY